MPKILLVEDEEMLRDAYRHILSTSTHEVHIALNGKEALELCKQHVYDLILLDLMMPVLDGVHFLKKFHAKKKKQTKVIVLSNLSSGKELSQAMDLGANKSLLKADLSPKQLLATVGHEVNTV